MFIRDLPPIFDERRGEEAQDSGEGVGGVELSDVGSVVEDVEEAGVEGEGGGGVIGDDDGSSGKDIESSRQR